MISVGVVHCHAAVYETRRPIVLWNLVCDEHRLNAVARMLRRYLLGSTPWMGIVHEKERAILDDDRLVLKQDICACAVEKENEGKQ